MTKYIGEREAIRLNNKGANIKSLRFANVYGGINYFNNKSSVVARFYEDDPLVINGDGLQTRDFIHVEDVCRCIWMALECEDIISVPMGVGTGINTSVLDLAKMFGKMYTFSPNSPDIGVDESPAEVVIAKKGLGFKTEARLKEYIRYLVS